MRPPPRFRDGPFAYHQEIEVRIDSLSNEGAGVARVDGWVVFIPFALPGEQVRARVFRNHARHSEADLVEVLVPVPERVAPECPLFGTCGGCQYQQLAYPAQLEWKRRQVAELLRHLAGVEFPVDPVVPSPRWYGYRSKITPHFQKPRGGDPGPIGFLKCGRRFDLVDVPACPIAMEEINATLPALRAQVRRDQGTRKRGATLLLRASCRGVATEPGELAGEVVEGIHFEFLAGDFFQNNPFILPAFTAHVRTEAAAGGLPRLADAYCGSGLFALTAARAFQEVAGIEVSASAVERARANARRNGIENARFETGDASALFAGLDWPGAGCAVIIDPPRRGTDAAFLAQLFAFAPRRVVYVSCNPATQMRDLQAFLAAGYQLRRVQPFDLFPQTKHLECVMTLEA
jgi:tRNA/tmRNA/rRNA uracil-C5-methylase (TrmA/RlmC/RlmD family)